MIYLESKNFHSQLNEWNQSALKRTWLASANYQVFSQSNLFQKLGGAYQEYGTVAGFLPGLPGALNWLAVSRRSASTTCVSSILSTSRESKSRS